MNKAALRQELLQKRKAISSASARDAAQALIPELLRLLPSAPCAVAGYVATQSEIDPLPALLKAADRGYSLALPEVVAGQKDLRFKRWSPGEPLQKGAYGIDCPLPGAPLSQPDVVLVPMLGFDAQGHRLGYGSGYYDATLAALKAKKPQIRAIGLAFSLQQLDRLPAEPHDIRLDHIISVTV